MNEFRANLTENGRILIPANCRKMMHLEPGDEVIIRVDNGVAEIFSLAYAVKRAQQKVKKYTKGKQPLSEQLIEMRRKEAKHE